MPKNPSTPKRRGRVTTRQIGSIVGAIPRKHDVDIVKRNKTPKKTEAEQPTTEPKRSNAYKPISIELSKSEWKRFEKIATELDINPVILAQLALRDFMDSYEKKDEASVS